MCTVRKLPDIRENFLGMSGNIFVCLRKLRDIGENFWVCLGKIVWRPPPPPPPPPARKQFWGEMLISDGRAN
jgi:hypothetical protein